MVGEIIQKLSLYAIIALAILITLGILGLLVWYYMVYKRRRRWKIEVYEQKTDGRVHSVGRDVLEERQRDWGTKTFYFLKKRHKVALPPPDALVDRMADGEEVDYLQLERQFFPSEKEMAVNYNDPVVNKRVQHVYDHLLKKISTFKTTFFNKEKLRDRFLYIPINKTLTADMIFKPIPYDVQLTVQRQVEMHKEFFKKSGTFWEKYGGVFLLIVIALILFLVVYLSYDFVNEVIKMTLGKVDSVTGALNTIADKMGVAKPPS
jgi:hypothetical protein